MSATDATVTFPTQELVLVRVDDRSSRIRSFTLCSTNGARFAFDAGQCLSIAFTHDGVPCNRYYSIASSPGEEAIEIVVRYDPQGTGPRYLWSLNPGARLRVTGPFGELRLRAPRPRAPLFIANGTGIAPIRSMVRALAASADAPAMTLLYGVRDQTDLVYDAEFTALARQRTDFAYAAVLTRPLEGWTGAQGQVQDHVARVLSEHPCSDAYLAGSPAMVESLRRVLDAAGFDPAAVIFEK